MKQVSAYETDDGQIFKDEAQARTHEMDNAVLTIGGVTVDQLRNALHGHDGTKAIRDALEELGDEVKRQNAGGEKTASNSPCANSGAIGAIGSGGVGAGGSGDASNVPQPSPVPPELQEKGEPKPVDHVFTDNGHIGVNNSPPNPDTGGS